MMINRHSLLDFESSEYCYVCNIIYLVVLKTLRHKLAILTYKCSYNSHIKVFNNNVLV